ncbi:hypothetical protein Q1695_013959 [Nippostrongylus brasiliensis]|nr:hypothetical protein Q1695_013959 [Nippostrongylus brasiliensis]
MNGTTIEDKNHTKNGSLFDTCPLIVYNHLDQQLLPFYFPNYNPYEDCKVYTPVTELVHGQVFIREDRTGYVCRARCILYKKGEKGYLGTDWVLLPSNKTFACDVVETSCVRKQFVETYLHTQIYEKEDNMTQLSENDTEISLNDTFKHDVYLIILDSVSTFMAKRSLPKTLEYLKKELGAVQMEFLNKVGDNSRPNGFPLAFGRSVEGGNRDLVDLPPLIPDWNNDEICNKSLDDSPYYLFQYSEKGYKTMIAQDYGVSAPYYPNCVGFENRDESDNIWSQYDFRRKELKEKEKSFEGGLSHSCFEVHLEMLAYLEKFMDAYPGTPKVGQIWPTTLAHESLKELYHTDVQFLDFFKRNRAVIDRSFTFFMGDHGPRREGIGNVELGRLENLTPFLVVIIPEEYRGSDIHKQLEDKKLRLMTNFDIHATLMDILDFQPPTGFSDTSYLDMEPISKGSSLFREWRGIRNCKTLPIVSDYCICQYNWTVLTNVTMIKALGNFLIDQLNLRIAKEGLSAKCANQTYKDVSQISYLVDNEVTVYKTVVIAQPSLGLFSGLIRARASGLSLGSRIERMNEYQRQGDCIKYHAMQPLCYCK